MFLYIFYKTKSHDFIVTKGMLSQQPNNFRYEKEVKITKKKTPVNASARQYLKPVLCVVV